MYNIYKGKINQITFSVALKDYIPGSTFVFMAKRRLTDPDSRAILKASSNLGILFDPVTGKGSINLTPATDAPVTTLFCDLQMISPQGVYVLEPNLTIAIAQPVNIATVS
jgi:hypothetical protein